MSPKLVAITGFKDAGKTTLAVEIIRELTKRGHRVGVIKHTDRQHEIDTPGKDTWRYRQAGAYASALVTSDEAAYFYSSSPDLTTAVNRLEACDLVILEGFKQLETVPKILVAKNMDDVKQLSSGLEIAVVGSLTDAEQRDAFQGRLDPEEVKGLASLVEEKSMPLLPGRNCGKCGYSSCKELAKAVVEEQAEATRCVNLVTEDVQLTVDGTLVNINTFVGQVLRNVVLGIVSTLKGVKTPTSVEVRLKSVNERTEGMEA